ncbi:MAG: signal recognition particle-docking protein FtsY [Myxococcales bacterium]|nr:signal recognition particle-docking protein FtsY [Myxococcales bacterium]
MPLDLFATAPAPVFDPTGLAVAAAVIGVVVLAAWLLLRKKAPTSAAAPVEADPHEAAALPSAEAIATAKALRRAARGGIKVEADGQVRRLGAFGSDVDPADLDARTVPERRDTDVITRRIAEPEPLAGTSATVARRAEDRAKLREGLDKTRSEGFIARLSKLFAGKQIDEAMLGEIEEVLYRADLGVKTTERLLKELKDASSRKELADTEHVWRTLQQRSLELLDSVGNQPLQLQPRPEGPAVLLVVGVNGSGKTTTIGKLAHRYAGEGRKVLVAAGDTFRAAAVDQLEVWCQRAGVPLHRGKENADPASVCFGAIERGRAEGFDLVVVDTAGRLHTNQGLMDELRKVSRVAAKAQDGAPHEVLLVLDATMGQNAVKQAEMFKDAIAVSGIVLTKLDGTAKGGVVLAIAEALALPVKMVGVGEKMEDLRDFDSKDFVEALFAR